MDFLLFENGLFGALKKSDFRDFLEAEKVQCQKVRGTF